jgi:predicted DNA binding CopG/RHH family protein
MKKDKLEKDEQELLESIEKGEWKSIKNVNAEKKRYREYARATLAKNRRVNIRIAERDLNAIQSKAVEEGIPYQTLMSSVLHKFVSGRLSEKVA